MLDFATYISRKGDVLTVLAIDSNGVAHFELFREGHGSYRPLQWGHAVMDETGNVTFPETAISKRTMVEIAGLLAQIAAGAEFPRSAFVPTVDGTFRVSFASLGPAVKGGNRWYDLRPLTLKPKKR